MPKNWWPRPAFGPERPSPSPIATRWPASVRAHCAGKDLGFKVIVGAGSILQDGTVLLAYPRDRSAYGRLCPLLTLGQRRAEKGRCSLSLADVVDHQDGMIFIAVPPPGLPDDRFADALATVARASCAPLSCRRHALLAAGTAPASTLWQLSLAPPDPAPRHQRCALSRPDRRPLQDVLTCIREKCTIHEAGYRLDANAERHLKSPQEMARLFNGHEQALARTIEIADQCTFSLDELRYEYPDEPVPAGTTPQKHLEVSGLEGR